jgi:hypothetical protein
MYSVLELNLIPHTSNYTKIDLESGTPIFSRIDSKDSIQIYDLKKGKESDDMILLEISLCKSDLSFWVSEKIDPYTRVELGRDTQVEYIHGRYVSKITPIYSTHYLSIKANNNSLMTGDLYACNYQAYETGACKVKSIGSEFWVKFTSVNSKNYTTNTIYKNGTSII